jgi:hypothetical protein
MHNIETIYLLTSHLLLKKQDFFEKTLIIKTIKTKYNKGNCKYKVVLTTGTG